MKKVIHIKKCKKCRKMGIFTKLSTLSTPKSGKTALSGTGTLNPANTYNVKSLVAGKVLTSTIEEGDIVEEGTVLYTVDASDATTKAEQASITLQQAQRSYASNV